MKSKRKSKGMSHILLATVTCSILILGTAACNSDTSGKGGGGIAPIDNGGAPATTDDIMTPTLAPDGAVLPDEAITP